MEIQRKKAKKTQQVLLTFIRFNPQQSKKYYWYFS